MKTTLSRRFWRGFGLWLWLLCLVGGALTHSACDCDGTQVTGDGGESVPEKKESPLKVTFVTPTSDQIISGQIDIEVEVTGGVGIQDVSFWANGKEVGTVYKQAATSEVGKPHFKVELATYLMERGPLHLKAIVTDINGVPYSETIQVRSRERWVASFGVGTIHQFQVRDDKNLYVRIQRTEEDMRNVPQPTRMIREGAALLTTNPVGTIAWVHIGAEQEFRPFLLGPDGRVFFGAKDINSGVNRFVAFGRGDPKWEQGFEPKPEWEHALAEWTVKGAPTLYQGGLLVHIVLPTKAGRPTQSGIIQLDAGSGRERWRYLGEKDEKMEILRGPFQLSDGRALFFTRPSGTSNAGFSMRMLSTAGTQLWSKDYPDKSLTTVIQNPENQYFYVGTEQRKNNEVTGSSVFCVEPSTGNECWQRDTKTSWPEHMALGNKLLIVLRRPVDGTAEVSAMQFSDGQELWKLSYKNHKVIGFEHTSRDSFFVMSQKLDASKDPTALLVECYDAAGKRLWEYEHKQFYPKRWLYSGDQDETFWVIVRNDQDPTERFGTRLIALDKQGERLYLFSEEARRFQQIQFLTPDALYLSSYYVKGGSRIHQLISKEK